MGLWIDRDENGRKQTENSDLSTAAENIVQGCGGQGQLQFHWKGEELELSAWGRQGPSCSAAVQGGADTSVRDRHH